MLTWIRSRCSSSHLNRTTYSMQIDLAWRKTKFTCIMGNRPPVAHLRTPSNRSLSCNTQQLLMWQSRMYTNQIGIDYFWWESLCAQMIDEQKGDRIDSIATLKDSLRLFRQAMTQCKKIGILWTWSKSARAPYRLKERPATSSGHFCYAMSAAMHVYWTLN
jgi:hypothetical protein